MLWGAFGVGPAELLILLFISALLLLPLVIAGVVLLIILAKKRESGAGRWVAAEPAGQPVRIRQLGPSDQPLADSVRWNGDELDVQANAAGTIRLFDVGLDNLDQCVLGFRFRIKTENLTSAVYPEFWCRVPQKGEFFSRGLNCKVGGTNDWKELEIPFQLQTGQKADLLRLNLVFEGPGAAKLKDIEILATPTKPS